MNHGHSVIGSYWTDRPAGFYNMNFNLNRVSVWSPWAGKLTSVDICFIVLTMKTTFASDDLHELNITEIKGKLKDFIQP